MSAYRMLIIIFRIWNDFTRWWLVCYGSPFRYFRFIIVFVVKITKRCKGNFFEIKFMFVLCLFEREKNDYLFVSFIGNVYVTCLCYIMAMFLILRYFTRVVENQIIHLRFMLIKGREEPRIEFATRPDKTV